VATAAIAVEEPQGANGEYEDQGEHLVEGDFELEEGDAEVEGEREVEREHESEEGAVEEERGFEGGHESSGYEEMDAEHETAEAFRRNRILGKCQNSFWESA
jgi:hypothetical protein